MVKKSRPVVRWDKPAYTTLQKIYEYIEQDSPANANKVREGILKITGSLPDHPEKYSPDKFKKNNPGHYRALKNTRIELHTNTPKKRS
jgi:plasmid stabilization system protein ParE